MKVLFGENTREIFLTKETSLKELKKLGDVKALLNSSVAIAMIDDEVLGDDSIITDNDRVTFVSAIKVKVISGANDGELILPISSTIKSIENEQGDVFNISPESRTMVNGKLEDKDYVLQDNDELEFIKPAGSKG